MKKKKRHQKNEIIEKIKDLTTKDRKEFNVSKNLINLEYFLKLA